MRNREIGKRRKQRGDCAMIASSKNGAFTMAQKAHLANSISAIWFSLHICVSLNEKMRWSLCFNVDDNYLLVAEADGRFKLIKLILPQLVALYTASFHGFWKPAVPANLTYVACYTFRFGIVGQVAIAFLTATRPSYNVANIDSESEDTYITASSICGGRTDSCNQPFDIYQQEDEVTTHFGKETKRSDKPDFLRRARLSPEITGHRYVYANSSTGNIYIFDISISEMRELHRPGSLSCDSS
ncbi:unnamed protein product [Litomosoides sigmodontis]|uniref:Uncharacterized protein n=1 Tax=Litomosoides sigmodontis TaxID=42156 RepID=A0A3P6U0M0_LITSI|nr:unnamed protein product [Litomosoides sigmodontis]